MLCWIFQKEPNLVILVIHNFPKRTTNYQTSFVPSCLINVLLWFYVDKVIHWEIDRQTETEKVPNEVLPRVVRQTSTTLLYFTTKADSYFWTRTIVLTISLQPLFLSRSVMRLSYVLHTADDLQNEALSTSNPPFLDDEMFRFLSNITHLS